MDPLILNSKLAEQRAGVFWDFLGSINWYNLIINWIIPITLFIFVAFQLREKYDNKQELYNEFIVF